MNSPIGRLQIVRGKNGRLGIRKQTAPKTEVVKSGDRDSARVRPVTPDRRR